MTVDLKDDNVLDKTAQRITINGCNYFVLPVEFYSQENDDVEFLVEKNLLKMEEKAREISLPPVYGKFKDEAHYLNSLDLLFLSTTETRNGGIFLKKLVLPRIETRGKFLDIGPGSSGYFVKEIGAYFESITLVDNNKDILKKLKNILPKNIEGMYCDLINFYPHEKYDLILMTHVLYYLEFSLWKEIIIRAYKALLPGGILVIALSDGLEKTRINSFLGADHSNSGFPIEETILNCDFALNLESEKYISAENFLSKSRVAMQHIVNVLLNDAKCIAEEETVVSYLEKFCKYKHGYHISSYQKFFVFQA